MNPKKRAPASTDNVAATGKKRGRFTEEERAAMKERARELRAEVRMHE